MAETWLYVWTCRGDKKCWRGGQRTKLRAPGIQAVETGVRQNILRCQPRQQKTNKRERQHQCPLHTRSAEHVVGTKQKKCSPAKSAIFNLVFRPRVLSARMRVNFPHSPRAYLRKENKHAGGLIGAFSWPSVASVWRTRGWTRPIERTRLTTTYAERQKHAKETAILSFGNERNNDLAWSVPFTSRQFWSQGYYSQEPAANTFSLCLHPRPRLQLLFYNTEKKTRDTYAALERVPRL